MRLYGILWPGLVEIEPVGERVLIMSLAGDSLVGILHEPTSHTTDLGLLMIVGGPQYRVGSHRQFLLMARSLTSAGYPVLRFDHRGMGDSSGEPRSFESIGDDIRSAIDTLVSEVPTIRRVALFGLCDAASAALIYGALDERVHGLVLANPWARTDSGEARAFVRHYYLQRLFQKTFWQKVLGGDFQIVNSVGGAIRTVWKSRASNRRAGEPIENSNYLLRMERGLLAFRGAMLFLISGRDLTAREFEEYCDAHQSWKGRILAGHSSQVVQLDADHTFSTRGSLAEATSAVLRWLQEQDRR